MNMMNSIDRRARLLAITWGVIIFLLPRTSSARQSQRPRSIPDVEFATNGGSFAVNNGSPYKVTGLDQKYLTGSNFSTVYLAEGATGYVSVNVTAGNRTFTLSFDGKLDTSNADKSKGFSKPGEIKSFSGWNPLILIPNLEVWPRVHLTFNIDLDVDVNVGLTTPKNNVPWSTIQGASRVWFINATTSFLGDIDGRHKSAQAHRSFHHQFSFDVVRSIDHSRPDNKTLYLLNDSGISDGPQSGLLCYEVSIDEILSTLFSRDKSLQSDPPQQGYSFLTDWIKFSEDNYGSDEWVKATATGKATITVDYAKLPPINKPLLPNSQIASDISLAKATTMDASSVTVDYTVSGKGSSKSIDFKFFRSSAPNVANDSSGGLLIGEKVDTQPSDLTSGKHTVTFLKGVDLPPDAKHPYVVVVATSGTDKSSTYFRKWRLAVVVHGYAGYDFGGRAYTSTWVKTMATTLAQYHYCDDAIRYFWIDDSIVESANMTKKHGADLAIQIREYIVGKANTHFGDVVDLLLIGHSRGTVVIGQTLNGMSPADVVGSYVQVVLLDCHPANLLSNKVTPGDKNFLCDFDDLATKVPVVKNMTAVEYLRDFQSKAEDPEIILPARRNIKTIDVWWQHTYVKQLSFSLTEGRLNLWGLGPSENRITNASSATINWIPVTTSSKTSYLGVGHDEVHERYQHSLKQQLP